MNTKHRRIKIIQQAIYSFRNILSCIFKMLDKCHSKSTDFTRQNTKSENVQNIFFCFFINPMLTLMGTDLKPLKKTVQMYEIMYNFCTVFNKQNFHKFRRKSQRMYCQMTRRIHEPFIYCQSNSTMKFILPSEI